jgi:hypothetical protein
MLQAILKKMKLYLIHDSLSKVTNLRKKCMPWEGTFDFWILLGITALNLIAVYLGITKLEDKDAIFSFKGCQSQNIQMIALVFAFIEATPGLLFIMYAACSLCAWLHWLLLLVSKVTLYVLLSQERLLHDCLFSDLSS